MRIECLFGFSRLCYSIALAFFIAVANELGLLASAALPIWSTFPIEKSFCGGPVSQRSRRAMFQWSINGPNGLKMKPRDELAIVYGYAVPHRYK